MRIKAAIAMFVVFVLVGAAAGVAGVWNGAFRVRDGEHDVPQLFTLKQAGNKIFGSGGPDSSEQYPVLHGHLVNGHLKFEVKSTLRDFVYDLKETNNELRGTVVITGGDVPVTAEIWLKAVH